MHKTNKELHVIKTGVWLCFKINGVRFLCSFDFILCTYERIKLYRLPTNTFYKLVILCPYACLTIMFLTSQEHSTDFVFSANYSLESICSANHGLESTCSANYTV